MRAPSGMSVAPQAKWIAVAIWSLVVQLDDGNVRGKEGNEPQDSRADRRVPLDLLELLGRQRARFARTASLIPILPMS